MNRSATRLAAAATTATAAAALFALAGCASPIPMVAEPLRCPISDELLAQRCASPASLPASASYGDLIKASLEDRNALGSCARHDQLLADAIRECNAAIDRYRSAIRAINEKNAK